MKLKLLRRYVRFWLIKAFAFVLRLFPLRLGTSFGASCGRLAFYLLPHERGKTLTHLRWAFGHEKSEEQIRQIGKETFAHLGRTFVEWQKMPFLSDEAILAQVETENFEQVQELLKKGKGLIVLTGHFGNWEWLAAYFGCLGYQGVVLARRIYFEPYNRELVALRKSHHVETFYRDDSPKKILKALANNHILGILPDQDVDKISGIFVPFFGRDAFTPTAPVALARASGAPLVPAFMVRSKDKFKLIFDKPIQVEKTKDREADIRRYTLEWHTVFEQYVRRYPDHWVWMHRRWKTRPEQKVAKVSVG